MTEETPKEETSKVEEPAASADWASGLASSHVTSPTPLKKKTPEQKEAQERKASRTDFAKQYKMRFAEVRPREAYPSSIEGLKFAKGSYIGVVGPPGAGKTRFLIQEIVQAAQDGAQSLYLYNESPRIKFDQTVMRYCSELGINDDVLIENCDFVDMHKNISRVAGYDDIKNFIKTVWVGQIRYWLEHVDNPRIVVIDSLSKIGRRFIPQLFELNEDFITLSTDLYEEKGVTPVTFMIHQKSKAAAEKNDDSVTGGFGLVHDLDAVYVFTLKHADQWDNRRYGVPEGKMWHSLMITKDRQSDIDWDEKLVKLVNGKLTLGETITEIIEKTKKQKSKAVERPEEETDVDKILWG